MSGLTVLEMNGNAGSLVTAWSAYVTALKNQANGSGTQADVATAATGLASAVTSLSNSPGFSTISKASGFVSGSLSLLKDVDAFKSAVAQGNSDAQNQAYAAIVADGSTIGTAVDQGSPRWAVLQRRLRVW
jgi:hypothetical protein